MCVTPFIPLHIEVMKKQIKDEQSKQESERRAHEAAVRAEELQKREGSSHKGALTKP